MGLFVYGGDWWNDTINRHGDELPSGGVFRMSCPMHHLLTCLCSRGFMSRSLNSCKCHMQTYATHFMLHTFSTAINYGKSVQIRLHTKSDARHSGVTFCKHLSTQTYYSSRTFNVHTYCLFEVSCMLVSSFSDVRDSRCYRYERTNAICMGDGSERAQSSMRVWSK